MKGSMGVFGGILGGLVSLVMNGVAILFGLLTGGMGCLGMVLALPVIVILFVVAMACVSPVLLIAGAGF